MPLKDYEHWNEEAEQVWWQEEGKHAESDAENAQAERDEAWRDEPEVEDDEDDGYIREDRD